MRLTIPISGLVLLGLLASVCPADAQAMKVGDLPPGVRTAVQAETAGATIEGVSKEMEAGRITYEIETTRNGKSRDLVFDAAGTLRAVEEEIDLKTAPAAVRAALEGRGRLVKLEAVTEGSAHSYEAEVERNGRTAEVIIDATGKVLKR